MIKCKLIYKNGKRASIEILDNDWITPQTEHALLQHCRYHINWYDNYESVILICGIIVDWNKFRNNSGKVLNEFLSGTKRFIDNNVHIIPLESNVKDDKFNFLVYNNKTSNNDVISVKDLNGFLISALNNDTIVGMTITNISYIPQINNTYEPIIFVEDDDIEITVKEFIDLKLEENDKIFINTNTGKITSPSINKSNFKISGICNCGNKLTIRNSQIVCDNPYKLCNNEYRNIINVYLSIHKNDELDTLYYEHYYESSKQFIDYLLSLDQLKFNQLTSEEKCDIFYIDHSNLFDNKLTINECIKALPYSCINMINKKEYINIIKGLYHE